MNRKKKPTPSPSTKKGGKKGSRAPTQGSGGEAATTATTVSPTAPPVVAIGSWRISKGGLVSPEESHAAVPNSSIPPPQKVDGGGREELQSVPVRRASQESTPHPTPPLPPESQPEKTGKVRLARLEEQQQQRNTKAIDTLRSELLEVHTSRRQEVAALEEELLKAVKANTELRKTVYVLEGELAEKEKAKAVLEARVVRAEGELAGVRAAHTTAVKAAEVNKTELLRKEDLLLSQKESSQVEFRRLKEELGAAGRAAVDQIACLEVENAQLVTANAQQDYTIAKLQDHVVHLQASADALTSENERLEVQLRAAQHHLDTHANPSTSVDRSRARSRSQPRHACRTWH